MGWLSDTWKNIKDGFKEIAVSFLISLATGNWAIFYTTVAGVGLRDTPDLPDLPERPITGGGATVSTGIPPASWVFGKRRIRPSPVWFGEAEHRWTFYAVFVFTMGQANRIVSAYSGEHGLQVPLVRGFQCLSSGRHFRGSGLDSSYPYTNLVRESRLYGRSAPRSDWPFPHPKWFVQGGMFNALPLMSIGRAEDPAEVDHGRFLSLHQTAVKIRDGDQTIMSIVNYPYVDTLISAGPYYDRFDEPSSSDSYWDSLIKVEEHFDGGTYAHPFGPTRSGRFRRNWNRSWAHAPHSAVIGSATEGRQLRYQQDQDISSASYRSGRTSGGWRNPFIHYWDMRINLRADARLASGSLPWGAAYQGLGTSYGYVEYRQSHDKTWNDTERNAWLSTPNLSWIIEGVKIQYPVLDAAGEVVLSEPEYTTNPAKIRAWGMMERRGVLPEEIDVPALNRAAAICDETILWHGHYNILIEADATENIIRASRNDAHHTSRPSGTIIEIYELYGTEDTYLRLRRAYIAHSQTIPYIPPGDINSGWTPLWYITPDNWEWDRGQPTTAGQARLYQGEIYVNDATLPANYFTAAVRSAAPDPARWRKLEATQTRRLPDSLATRPEIWKHCPGIMKRYEAHGEFVSGVSPLNQERQIDRAMDGSTVEAGGKYYITAGRNEHLRPGGYNAAGGLSVPVAPRTSITDIDLVNNGLTYLRVTPAREHSFTTYNITLPQCETVFWEAHEFSLTDSAREQADGQSLEGRAQTLESVSNVMQARGIANAALIDARDPTEVSVEVSPRLGAESVAAPDYALANLRSGDIVSIQLEELGPQPRMMMVNASEFNLQTGIVSLGLISHTPGVSDHYIDLPPVQQRAAIRVPAAPTRTVRGLNELVSGASSFLNFADDIVPAVAGAPLVCAAGMSIDKRFIFVGTNPTDNTAARIYVFDTDSGKVGALENATYWTGGGTTTGTPGTTTTLPPTPTQSTFSYVLTDADAGNRIQVRVRYTDAGGTLRTRNGYNGPTVAPAGELNEETGEFNDTTQTGNWASGETITGTILRDNFADWADADLTVFIVRRTPGSSPTNAPVIHTFTLAAERTAVPAGPRFALGLSGIQGYPFFDSVDVYEDGSNVNALTFPLTAPQDDPRGFVFDASGTAITATAWFEDSDPPNERTARDWEFYPGLRWKTGRDTGRLGPQHSPTGSLMVMYAGWDARPGQTRMMYAGEQIGVAGSGNTSSLSSASNVPVDANSPWFGTLLFEGNYPVRTDYTAILQGGSYSYWLRTTGVLEIRGSIYLWDRQAPIARYESLDVPPHLINPRDSIAVRSVDGTTIELVAFKADGSGFYDLTNASGQWVVVEHPA